MYSRSFLPNLKHIQAKDNSLVRMMETIFDRFIDSEYCDSEQFSTVFARRSEKTADESRR